MKNAISILAILFLLVSCSDSNDPSSKQKENVKKIVSGRIVDENGNPISNATVKIGQASVNSNSNGLYKIANATDSSGFYLIHVQKSGYYDSFRRIRKSEVSSSSSSISMKGKNKVTQFMSSQGTTVNLSNGGKVTIPANGICNELTKQPYNGSVDMFAFLANPDQEDYANDFPGDFTARETNGATTGLYSFGIHRIELYSPDGQKLNLKDGATARLMYPIPDIIKGKSIPEIPIWHFNENSGIWEESGKATIQGNYYVVDVKHFSVINLDWKGKTASVIVTVVDCEGNPVAGATVSLGSGQGSTDSEGKIKFINVPAEMGPNGLGAEHLIKVSATMNGGITSVEYTLRNLQENEVREVTIAVSSTSISGRITDCNDNAYTGMVTASWGTNGFASYFADGSFTIPVPMNTIINLSVENYSQSVTVPNTCANIDLGNIKINPSTGQACGNNNPIPSGDYYVTLYVDGVNYSKTWGVECGGGVDQSTLSIGVASNSLTFSGGIANEYKGVGTYNCNSSTMGTGTVMALVLNQNIWATYGYLVCNASGSIKVTSANSSVVSGSFSGTLCNPIDKSTKTVTGTFKIPVLK